MHQAECFQCNIAVEKLIAYWAVLKGVLYTSQSRLYSVLIRPYLVFGTTLQGSCGQTGESSEESNKIKRGLENIT